MHDEMHLCDLKPLAPRSLVLAAMDHAVADARLLDVVVMIGKAHFDLCERVQPQPEMIRPWMI